MDSMKGIIAASEFQRRAHLRVIRDAKVPEQQEVKNTCKKCKGAGYLREDVPFGHPHFGQALPCDCKRESQKKRQQQQLIESSGILSLGLFERASFATFDQSLPGVFQALRHAQAFADEPSGWLVLVGPYGCGKTHLAVSVARARIGVGDTVLVQTVPDLLDHLRDAYGPGSQNYSEKFEEMKRVDLLVLDDYGAQNDTPWATEKLFQLLNSRYNGQRATVVTSNDLENSDPRLYSRMHDRKLVRMVDMDEALDYRMHGEDE